jgi:hypothetical protein
LAAIRGSSDLASGRISLGAGLAISLAPFALGALTDIVGVQQAFLIFPGLLVVAVGPLAGGRLSQ